MKPKDKAPTKRAAKAGLAIVAHPSPADASAATADTPKRTGRPSLYTPEIAAQIVARLADGEPLRQICRTEGFPAWQTVYDWMARDEALSRAIAHARDVGTDAIAEQIVDVAFGRDGSTGDVVRDKLVVDALLKLLAKWNPKKYGERIQQDMNINESVESTLSDARRRLAAVPAKSA
jgi:hypothetical protein